MNAPTADPVLADVALRIRRHVVDACAGPEGGHLGGSLSCTDLLVALYFRVLRVDPADPDHPDRDVFLLSKGHAAIALYATLAERGFFDPAELAGYGRPGSRLMAHPVRTVPGVELPTGSLGHGLALGLGFALAGRLSGVDRRTFVLLGDGELQEGSVWEAALVAAAQRADRLVAIVDANGLQLTGAVEDIGGPQPIGERWAGFGWAVRYVDGHDTDAVAAALDTAPWTPGRPSVLVARTVKGQGVPMVAGKVAGHYATLSPPLHARAVRGLRGAGERP
ncbi:MAG TPA: transketolase [Mycobacteriales bacterium]|nr:transketolase [Mycobacteriales bacterium]